MKKLSKTEMKGIKGGVLPGGGWTAGCANECAWVRTVVGCSYPC